MRVGNAEDNTVGIAQHAPSEVWIIAVLFEPGGTGLDENLDFPGTIAGGRQIQMDPVLSCGHLWHLLETQHRAESGNADHGEPRVLSRVLSAQHRAPPRGRGLLVNCIEGNHADLSHAPKLPGVLRLS